MSVALQKPMTLAEFLDWEERQELRYEFDRLEPVELVAQLLPLLPGEEFGEAHALAQRDVHACNVAVTGEPRNLS